MGATISRTCFLVGAAIAAVLVAGPASAAPAPDVSLQVTPSQATYTTADPVTLRVVVGNQASAACALLDAADGALDVLGATRNGQPLAPSISDGLPIDGATALIQPYVTTVSSGANTSFTVDAGGPQGLPAMTPVRDGTVLVASWPTGTPGRYTLTLAYQVPPLAGPTACPDQSNPVTVAYTVVAAPAVAVAKHGVPVWWWAIGLALVAVVVLVLVLLLRRRLRRHPPQSAGAGAVAAVFAIAAIGAVLVAPPAAHAGIFLNAGTSTTIPDQYANCIAMIQGFDPSILATLSGPNSPTVVIYPWITSSREDLAGGSPRDSLIRWAYNDKSHIIGENGNVNYDPCAELYHELVHAKDAANNNLHNSDCDNTGIPYDEVVATFQENLYRAHYHLPLRTTYDRKPLPTSLAACTPPTTPPTKPGNTRHCSPNECANSAGDPHLTTFDGLRYDFQGAGEFTEAQSTAGDMTIQVRDEPYPNSTSVAVTTGIAIRAGSNRLGFYLVNGTITTHRDGAVVTLPDGSTPLAGGLTIARSDDPYTGESYDISWPDGSVASVWRTGAIGLVVTLTPASARRGTFSGLFGNFDGDSLNDVTVRGGAVLASPPAFDALYPTYADSWRITDATSLFDYDPGQDTATFTDKSFPAKPPALTGAAQAAANAACAAAGVTDPGDLADCIIDVAATGQAPFAANADDMQNLAASAPPTSLVSPLSGTITAPGGTTEITYQGTKGQRLYVNVVSTTLPPHCGVLILVAPDGRAIGYGCIGDTSAIDAVLLPETGTYTLVIGPDGTATGTTTVQFIATVDQSVTGAIDGPPTTLSVAAAGGQSRLIFNGTSGQIVYVTATAPTLPPQCGALDLLTPSGGQLASGCFGATGGYIDASVLPQTGQYAILLDPAAANTGQITIHITSATDQTQQATIGGAPVTMTIAQPGAVSRVTFSGTAGESVQATISGSTLPDQCSLIGIEPAGGSRDLIDACVSGGIGLLGPYTLPTSGAYTLVLDPNQANTGHLTVTITAR